MKLTYRPEIDGLRAIAVGAVILYHAQITILGHQPFKGGFIGVDIFFVISGYLIASIILQELVTTGSFSFKYFYERRIRRILPVLLFVMLVSLPFAWVFLLPSSFVDFSKSILYSLGFSSNFYFYYSGQQYGAESGLLKPFLHTWSLSVEEQFYILFPIVLLITFNYFRKYLIHVLIFGFIISLGIADWCSRNYPSFNFYVLPTRGWELLAGSILAYFEITKGKRSQTKILNLILPGVGLILIGHSILFFNEKMFHPSFYTLSPIIGVCLIIWFSNKKDIITKILSTKLFVGIGLISYSLYLWHYPIFAYARITEFFQGGLFNQLLLVIIIVILSTLSYYFVERPARNKKNKFKVILSLFVISIFFLFIINFNVIKRDGYKDRVAQILETGMSTTDRIYLKNSHGENCHDNIEGCKFNTSSNKKVYVIGDSQIGYAISPLLKEKLIKNNYQFITMTLGNCLFFPGFDMVDVKTQKIIKTCNNNYFQKLKLILSKDKNSIVIIGGRFPLHLSNYYFDNQEGGIEGNEWNYKYVSLGKYETIQTSFKNEISKLSKNHKIILIYPIPEVGWNVSLKLNNLFRKLPKNVNKKKIKVSDYITTSVEVYKKRVKSSFELLDSIQGNNIYRVYPHILFCGKIIKDRCVTHDDKNLFYIDNNHSSLKGAEMINDLLIKEIEKIELKSN
jgi:peptidoglycan/LPS O-acetylase OafA/YrhL